MSNTDKQIVVEVPSTVFTSLDANNRHSIGGMIDTIISRELLKHPDNKFEVIIKIT